MRYTVACSAMAVLALGSGDSLASLGVAKKDFSLVTGSAPWMAPDRNRVRATLDALLFGSMDAIGVPRFEAPAEYVAACVGMFVAPVNLMVACRWMEASRTADVLGADDNPLVEPTTAARLFSLVVQLSQSDEAGAARAQFEKQTRLAVDHAMKVNVPKESQ